MVDEAAFFRFGNNAGETAREIALAMESIQRNLSRPIDTGQIFVDTQAFRQGFSRLEANLGVEKQKIQTLLSDLGSGAINKGQFNQQLRSTISSALANVPTIVAQEAANMDNRVSAGRLPFGAISRQAASEYAQQLVDTVVQGQALANGRLNTLPFKTTRPFASLIPDAEAALPVNSLNRLQQLRLHQTAEQIMLRSADPVGQGMRDVKAAGLGQQGVDILLNQLRETKDGDSYIVPDKGVAQEVAQLTREATAYVGAAQRAAKATTEWETALGLLSSGVDRRGAVLLGPDGIPFKQTTSGAAQETNPLKVSQYEEEARNLQRVLDPDAGATAVGKYRVIGDEVYKMSTYGAVRVRHEGEIADALSRQATMLQKQVNDADRLAAAEARRALRAQQNESGLVGGFMGRFHRGDQSVATSLGAQIASAASFSLAYGALFAVQNVLRDTLSEFLDYQDSVTDLEVAMQSADSVTNRWVTSLSDLSRLSGSNMGQALDTAARGVRAFASGDSSTAEKEAVGTSTVETSTKLALIAGKSMTDATGDVVAVGTAFGLASDQLNQVVDAVANAKRNVGGDSAQIAQGLSLFALSAQEAGFNLNEAAAVIGLVQARTDQSGQAIATRLTRIFQITSGSTGKSLATELGVDSDQSVKKQIEAFANIYSDPGTSEGVKDRISSALGGTANMRELLPLLKENSRLQEAYNDALQNSGQGTDEFNRKSDNLVGTLKKIGGDLSNLQVNLAQSGIFDGFAAGAAVLEPALYTLNQFLASYRDLVEEVPGLRTVVGLLIDVGIAYKAVQIIKNRNGLFSGMLGGGVDDGLDAESVAGASRARAAAEAAMIETITRATTGRAAAEAGGTAGEVLDDVPIVATGAPKGRMAGLLGFLSSPKFLGGVAAAGAFGLLAAIGKNDQNGAAYDSMVDRSTNTLNAFDRVGDGTGPLSGLLETAAADMRSAAGDISKGQTGRFWEGDQRDLANENASRSAGLLYLAERVRLEEQQNSTTRNFNLVASGAVETVQQLADGLATISQQGGTALTQIRALRRQLETPPPPAGSQYFRPEQLKAEIITGAGATLVDAIKAVNDVEGRGDVVGYLDGQAPSPGYTMGPPSDTASVYDPRIGPRGPNNGGMPNDAYAQAWAAYNGQVDVDPNKVDDPGRIASLLLGEPARGLAGLLGGLGTKENEGGLLGQMERALQRRLKNHGLDGSKPISDQALTNLVTTAVDKVDLAGALGESAAAVRAAWIKESVKRLQGLNSETSGIRTDLLNDDSLTTEQILTILNPSEFNEEGKAKYPGLLAAMEAGRAAIPADDDGTAALANARADLRILRTLGRKNTDGEIPQLNLAITQAEVAVAEMAVGRLEDMREAAESRADSNKELRQIRVRFAKRAFRAAGANRNLIESLMESMDRQTIRAVIDYQETAVEIARAAYRHALQLVQQAQLIFALNPLAGLPGLGVAVAGLGDKKTGLDDAQASLDALNSVFQNNANVSDDVASLPEEADDKKTAEELAQERAAKTSAMAQARAARIGGGIASARAALISARAEMNAAKKGTTEWYQALASFYEAQWAMKSAIEEYHSNLYRLEGDITDPVEAARDELKAARERLANARSKDDRAAAQVDVRMSEAALERARWDQKLSDMQVAEQLGRISYGTYVRYLERESDRMHKMRNKTRQQIDHMNEIDLALKEAMDAGSGQFNLGDIRTNGFIYQTRRFAAQQRAGNTLPPSAGLPHHVQNNNNVTINGTDVHMVRRVLREMLGDQGRTRSTNSTRRGR